jgi:hypothetical protein
MDSLHKLYTASKYATLAARECNVLICFLKNAQIIKNRKNELFDCTMALTALNQIYKLQNPVKAQSPDTESSDIANVSQFRSLPLRHLVSPA